MAKGRYKIKFDHVNKQGTMSMVDSEDNILFDHKGQLLSGMDFPYWKLEAYPDFFEKIEDNGEVGVYYFPSDN